MLSCLAAFVAGASMMTDPLALTTEVQHDAQALVQVETPDPAFYAALADFAADAQTLSDALRAAGASDDLPCIFHGISQDAVTRSGEIAAADNPESVQMAMNGLRALLNDAILLAPLAGQELTPGS